MKSLIFPLIIFILFMSACQSPKEKNETPTTPFDEAPAWAQEAIWYQIFVERFRNGDPSNDPTPADIEGSYPGYMPADWQLTPWGHDWHKPDPYFKELEGTKDFLGNEVTNFGQMAQMRRYGGDLQGVLDKIDYIESLGVNAIYFNPLNDAPSLHKYDARNWRHIDRNFGPTPEEDAKIMAAEIPDDPSTWKMTGADKMFVKVIEEFHKRDIKVILDFSWNHTGHRFWAWLDVVKNQAQSKYKDWYWVDEFKDPNVEGSEFKYKGWLGVADLPEIRETEYHDHAKKVTPFEGDMVSQEVKEHIFNVTKRWLDPNGDGDPSDGVDGFRLDVAAEVPLGFWRQYRKVVRETNPNAYLVGEVWWETYPDDLLDPAVFVAGDVFDAVMNYRWYRTTRHFFNESPDTLQVSKYVDHLKSLENNIRKTNHYAMMNVAASHDAPRLSTSLFNKNKYKFNATALADENYKIHKPDAQTMAIQKMLLVQQFTYIGAPHIWAGDEMGMWGGDDPDSRKPLIWKDIEFEPEATHPLGLERPVNEVKFNDELFAFYQKLVQLRKNNPVLNTGEIDFFLVDDENQLLGYRRFNADSEAWVVFNKGNQPQKVTLPIHFSADKYQSYFGNKTTELTNGKLTFTLPAESYEVWLINN